MNKTLVLVRRNNHSSNSNSQVMSYLVVNLDNRKQLLNAIDSLKNIASDYVSLLNEPEFYFVILSLNIGETILSSGGKSSILWRVHAKELLPDKWKRIVKNGRNRWVKVNKTQQELF